MNRLATAFRGSGLMARAVRSASWLVIGHGGSQALRLISNLILTRLLFPEAFGLMSLVAVVLTGLSLFSDVGINASIVQSKRGDDPDFLNTAWTVQVIRGAILFLAACLLAGPISRFYDEPLLASYLPIGAAALLIAGFNPTRILSARRHLLVGRLTTLNILAQIIGIVFMIVVALLTRSILSLVLGGIVQAAALLVLTHYLLPGDRNRFRWDRAALIELTHFGKWIFVATAMTFVVTQGDRAILGRFLSLDMLGFYNIGFFLGSFPAQLGLAANQTVMMPIYRDTDPARNATHRRKLRRMRGLVTAASGGLLLLMALVGPYLASIMYDARYDLAQPLITLVALTFLPQAIVMTYDPAALSAGDSRGYFFWVLARALAQSALVLVGITHFGVAGAIAGLGVSVVLAYPVLVRLAVKHHIWDPLHDALAAVILLPCAAGILWFHADLIALLAQQ